MSASAPFVLVSENTVCSIFVADADPAVGCAVHDLKRDVEKITGRRLADVDAEPERDAVVIRISPMEFGGAPEAYTIRSLPDNKLEIVGSDDLGAIFGIYRFSEEFLGVDPFFFWNGYEPQKGNALEWADIDCTAPAPKFRFRGWFINDEDLLTGCFHGDGKRELEYPFYREVVDAAVIDAVAETLLRNYCNLIIPASFVSIMNPPEKALLDVCAKRGIFLSMHHVEPMGVSAFSFRNYYKARGEEHPYSWYEAPEALRRVWTEYALAWSRYPKVIWQLGLRGVADRPMWHGNRNIPRSDEARAKIISSAIDAQYDILKQVLGHAPEYFTITLWMEGAKLNAEGLLRFPANSIIVFADNCCGWRWQSDFYEAARQEDCSYGVYYHLAVITGTHLAQSVPPERAHRQLREAYRSNADKYAIVNVSNIREFQYGIAATSRIMIDPEGFSPAAFRAEWCRRHFPAAPEAVASALERYFAAFALHPVRDCAMLQDQQTYWWGARRMLKKLELPPRSKLPDEDPNADSEINRRTLMFDVYARLESDAEMAAAALEQARKFDELTAELEMIPAEKDAAEREFFFDSVVYPARLMAAISRWGGMLFAALDRYDRGESPYRCLAEAEAALADFMKLIPRYCHGKWRNWYIDCRKNFLKFALEETARIKVLHQK